MTVHETAVAVKSATGVYSAAGAVGTFVVSLIGLIGLWVKFGPKWREITVNADQRFRDDLLGRVETLERTLEHERAIHNAERAVDRHRINNVTQCLDALLLLLEAAPERATEAVAKIKEMRAKQLETEAVEKAAIHAAEIAAKGTAG